MKVTGVSARLALALPPPRPAASCSASGPASFSAQPSTLRMGTRQPFGVAQARVRLSRSSQFKCCARLARSAPVRPTTLRHRRGDLRRAVHRVIVLFTNLSLAAADVSILYLGRLAEPPPSRVQPLHGNGVLVQTSPRTSRFTRSRRPPAVLVSASSGAMMPLLVPTVLDRVRSSVISAVSFGLVRPLLMWSDVHPLEAVCLSSAMPWIAQFRYGLMPASRS